MTYIYTPLVVEKVYYYSLGYAYDDYEERIKFKDEVILAIDQLSKNQRFLTVPKGIALCRELDTGYTGFWDHSASYWYRVIEGIGIPALHPNSVIPYIFYNHVCQTLSDQLDIAVSGKPNLPEVYHRLKAAFNAAARLKSPTIEGSGIVYYH